jgi:hypothetical protein
MATLFEETSGIKEELEKLEKEGSVLDAYALPNVKTSNERYTVRQVGLALDAAGGFITYAARILKCRVETVRQYIKNYPILAELVSDVNETHLDTSEIALFKKRDAGDNSAIFFHLKCKGKKRGWIDNPAIQFHASLDLEKANWKDIVDEASKIISGEAPDVCLPESAPLKTNG